MLRYRSVGHAAIPPPGFFTVSPVPNDERAVFVRVMPVVALPDGSFVASANWMFASATMPFHTGGTLLLSAFFARKSLLRTETWLLTCVSEMFCEAVL